MSGLLALILLAAPAAGGDMSRTGGSSDAPAAPQVKTVYRVYSMPSAVYYEQQAQWQRYLKEKQSERDRDEAVGRVVNVLPPAAYRKPYFPARPGAAPPPRDLGPTSPGEVTEFKDTYVELVRDFVRENSRQNGGAFAVSDDVTGETYALRLRHIHADALRMLSSTEAVACADFETIAGPKREVDLDFVARKDWDWTVGDVFLHGVNGRLRFAYDSRQRRVPIAAKGKTNVPKPTAPAQLSAEVRFHEPSGDGRLSGGETGGLEVTVRNAGPGAAYAVTLTLDPGGAVEGLDIPGEVEFGTLQPGQTMTKDVPVAASEKVASAKVGVTLTLREGNGFDTEPVLVPLETRAFEPPRLEIAEVSLPGGVVKKGEVNRVSVLLKNTGRGAARAAAAELRLGAGLYSAGEASAALGALAPGESRLAKFEIFVNNRFRSGEELPAALALSESTGRHGQETPLRLRLGQGAPAFHVLPAARTETAAAPPSATPAFDDVDRPPSARTPRSPDSFAVVVGIEKYRDLPAVDYAARDAQTVYAYLTEAMGFPPENVALLQNDRAGYADLTTYLGPWLSDRVGPHSRVFVYFAGHGTPDPKTGDGSLVPYDGAPGYAQTKALSLRDLYASLGKLKTDDVTVALDSCFSGMGERSVIAAGIRPLVRAAPAPVARNVVTLSAAAGDQISASSVDARHGLLTYFMLKGLRGEADADRDGKITTLELYRYLRPAVSKEARKQHVEQEPVLSPDVDAIGAKGSRVWLAL